MIDFLSAFGLAGATGLNAYLPLLIVGLLARFTDLVTLAAPWNTLENPWVLGVLGVLLLVEMTVDKIPAADTVNDVIQTAVRPIAGAILFAAFATGGSDQAISHISPVLAAICGLLTAGGVHAAKAVFRPVVTTTTAGIGNPIVSVAEDVVSGTTTLVAVLLPVVAAAIVLIIVAFFLGFYLRRRRRRTESF
jgi:uncharacterized membrane protein